jgi:uncharacterized membrane protein (DUF485 family)
MMSEGITLEEYKNAYFEVYTKQRKKSFFLHLTIYILVNVVSIIINIVFTPTFLWVVFPIVFWGIGIVWNYLGAFIWIDERLHETSLKAEDLARKKRKKQ